MILVKTILLLFILPFVDVKIYIFNTVDSSSVELYDCILQDGLFYCRRPTEPMPLNRSSDAMTCYHNGTHHSFADLRRDNVNTSTILHQWKSSIERVEHYTRYLKNDTELDEYICECTDAASFGKNCEYLLPMGKTFAQTLALENHLRRYYPRYVQQYGDIICYKTLDCNSGLLCLDWRDICDGVQQCMSGLDEDNCDKLEYNECENDEYRCMNGMCVPNEYFLDGEFDCLDWSDEIQYYDDVNCPIEVMSAECDDRICPPYQFSCGDGQCIRDRFDFQKLSEIKSECRSRRDQYHMCETHYARSKWTLPNGRCYEENDREVLNITDLTIYGKCEYLLKCVLSQGLEIHCPCGRNSSCGEQLNDTCSSNVIQYPKVGIMAPYMLFFYNRTRNSTSRRPDFTWLNGTIKCNGILINMSGFRFSYISTLHQVEDALCAGARNASTLTNSSMHEYCQNQNQSLTFDNRLYNFSNVCNKTKKCISTYRIKDGFVDCVDKMDEFNDSSIPKVCSEMQRYRFRCSAEESTCLSVMALGNLQNNCKNKFDELWLGTSTQLVDINCNKAWKYQCEILRQYIENSWVLNSTNQVIKELRIPFRHHCDTFWNLDSKEDENVTECREQWVCADEQWRCATGQCIDGNWVLDDEWDCFDASDEDERSDAFWTDRNLQIVPAITLSNKLIRSNKSKPFSSLCDQTTQFPCLPTNFSNQLDNLSYNRTCISKDRVGDGHIDCYGAIDERNTITHCNQQSMLGYNFKCISTNGCIPYWNHCLGERCNNSLDDESWCGNRQNVSNCNSFTDALCFNGTCVKNGRCNRISNCIYGEDEYMCEYQSIPRLTGILYRKDKEILMKNTEQKLRLIRFPSNSNATPPTTGIISTTLPVSLTPNQILAPIGYWCNRGVGVTMYNGSIVCFCPPQYYGDKCQFHTDRITVLIHLNFTQSNYTIDSDVQIVFKILILFLFNDEIITNHITHVRPVTEIFVYTKKLAHLLYSRSSRLLQHKTQRYVNQSNIVDDHPYSVRIEIYERLDTGAPVLHVVWQYPVYFDYLPVFRFSKVLRLTKPTPDENPCSSNPCHQNQDCRQLQNKKSNYICLCKANFTGENCSIPDQRCMNGYCAYESICKPTYRGLLLGNELPYCICPFDQFGEQCDIIHDQCQLTPCENNGTCYATAKPDTISCVCTEEYHGINCELRKPEIKLFINESVSHAAAVVQYFDIDFVPLNLILSYQQVYRTLPNLHKYRHEQKAAPEIILVKLYSSHKDISPELYLISVHVNVTTIYATTQVSEKTRCMHIRTLISANETQGISNYSPIKYHFLCQNNTDLFCFRDDFYLCICDENHSRVECFLYNYQLDQCSHCLAGGRCLKGDRSKSNDYICLCPPCHSGTKCQFNSNSFAFTLDQLFFTDLNSVKQQKITLCLLIIIPLLLALIALPNNLFSFATFRREKCLSNGAGYYLLLISIINQINLSILVARLIHLSISITGLQSHPIVDNILCKILNYLLICFTRIAYWLVSFVATERVYTIVFLKGQWLKKPYVAQRLIALMFFIVFASGAYELVFIGSFSFNDDGDNSMCVIEFPMTSRLNWMLIHRIVWIIHSMLPLLINLCCTITMIYIITKSKVNIRRPEQGNEGTDMTPTGKIDTVEVEGNDNKNLKPKEIRHRLYVLRDVISDNREIISRPTITLIPSIFSLFSLPLFIISFSLGCRNIENHPTRYALIVFNFISFIPQIITFFLYVYPSSLYFNEWRLTRMGQWITALKRQSTVQNTIIRSTPKEETKLKNFSKSKQ